MYYKKRKDLLQNAFYKMRRFYYKIRRLFKLGQYNAKIVNG